MASSESSGAPPSTLQTSSSADAAGCGAYAPSTLCTNPECDSTSQFVTQLYGLPTAHYIFHLYGQIKASNRLFTVSLNMLESVAAVIVKPIHSRIGEQVALADKQAARCVEAISQKYPFVHGNPAHIVETVKTRSVRTVQKGARVIVRSYPGQLLFKGVDLSLRATLGAGAYLNKVANPPESESAPPLSSENTATTETDPTDTTTCPVLSLTHSLRKTWQSITLPGPVRKSINIPVALLKRLTSLLKRFRHILRRIEGRKRRSHRHGSDARSPDRLNQIETRRKITPKKRSSTGVFQRVKFTAQRLLGLKQTTNPTLDKAVMTCGLDKGSDADKKRKHDDILTDDSDESMYTFDLDNYKSEDDPDFESPSDYSSTDSLEYGDGDTESDIEFEETYVGQTLMVKQIKETSTRKDEKACKEVITPKTTQDTKGQLDTKAVEAGTKGQLDTKPVDPGMKGQLDTKAVELGTKGQLDTKTVESVTKGQLDSKTVEPVTKGQLDSKKMELDTKGQLDSSKERIGEKSGQVDVKSVKSVHVDVKTAKTGHVDVKKLTDTEKNSPVDANKGKDTEKPLDIKKGKDSEKMDRKPVVNGHHEKSGLQSVAKGSVDAKGKPQTQPAPIKDAKSSKQGVHDGSSDKPSAKTADGQPVSADTRKN